MGIEQVDASIAKKLREISFEKVLPSIGEAFLSVRNLSNPTPTQLREVHDASLILLFRLLVIAISEESGILPLNKNSTYSKIAIKSLLESDSSSPSDSSVWDSIIRITQAMRHGDEELGILSFGENYYFDDDQNHVNIEQYKLSDEVFLPILRDLFIHTSVEGEEQFLITGTLFHHLGTIYEGLLETDLAVAKKDLSSKDGRYSPHSGKAKVVVKSGRCYLHNGGRRKSSASYYTKPIAVEYLVNRSLGPALDDHLKRLNDIDDDSESSEALFDFSVVDISMGSGNFFWPSIEIIVSKFEEFLDIRPLDGVDISLEELRKYLADRSNVSVEEFKIGKSELLRLEVARRCIYGVDIDPRAVGLARICIWMHTHIEGSSISLFSHRIRCGNSIFGVATESEAKQKLENRQRLDASFGISEEKVETERQMKVLSKRTALLPSSSIVVSEDDSNRLEPWKSLMDMICAVRLDNGLTQDDLRSAVNNWNKDALSFPSEEFRLGIEEALNGVEPFHFMSAFPEVFWRENPGFDVILGNPPWDEATVEIDQFLMRHIPGFKGMKTNEREQVKNSLSEDGSELLMILEGEKEFAERNRELMLKGGFPGMDTGDPDLYKAFSWRFWRLLRTEGRLGIVVPRSLFSSLGSAEWRKTVFPSSISKMVYCKNKGEWLFGDVNPAYMISLFSLKKVNLEEANATPPSIEISGTFSSVEEFENVTVDDPSPILIEDIVDFDSEELCIPLLNGGDEWPLWKKLANFPPIQSDQKREDFDVRLIRELDATNDRNFFKKDGDTSVHNHLNVERLQFNPAKGEYAKCNFSEVETHLIDKRERTYSHKSSPFYVIDLYRSELIHPIAQSTHPINTPRIVIRDVVHGTNERKVWAALFPTKIPLTNISPYLHFPEFELRNTIEAKAYLLGMLSSGILDWYGHTKINLHLNKYIFNSLPVPQFDNGNSLHLRLAELAGNLALTENGDYGEWQERFGEIENPLEMNEGLIEIDAIASMIYELTDEECALVFDGKNSTRSSIDNVLTKRASNNKP